MSNRSPIPVNESSTSNWTLFYLVWGGQGVSKFAGPFQMIALALWALDAGHGALGMALITSVTLLGTFTGSIFGGSVADTFGTLRTVLFCDAIRFVGSGAIAYLIFANLGASYALILILCFLSSITAGIFNPALRSLTPEFLTENDYEKGNSVFGAVENTSQLGGALLGGISMAIFGPAIAIMINSASFLIGAITSVVALYRLRSTPLISRRSDSPSLLSSTLDGFKYALATPWLIALICVDAVIDLVTAGQLYVGLPLIAERSTGGIALGLLLCGYAGGALIGSLISAYFRTAFLSSVRGVLWLNIIQAPFLTLVAFVPLPGAVGCLAIGGIINAAAMTYYISLIQRAAPQHMQARIMSLLMAGGLLLQPFGTLLLGAAADYGYLHSSFVIGGVIMILTTTIALNSNAIHTIDRPVNTLAMAPNSSGTTPH